MKDYRDWFHSSHVRPFVFVRKNNIPKKPGTLHDFEFPQKPLVLDPFFLENSKFATQILRLENRCFRASGMTIPRWAFYDCSIMPGLVAGFAYRRSALPKSILRILPVEKSLEFVPISLFICIPTNEADHWVAHNLCSVSSILPSSQRFANLGFVTKAFGLWYFNIKKLYGVTQWGSHSIKVHSNYGDFQIVSAFNEIHDYPDSLTYLVDVKAKKWRDFLDDAGTDQNKLRLSPYRIDPKKMKTMKALQTQLEKGKGPFFLNGKDFLEDQPKKYIQIYYGKS